MGTLAELVKTELEKGSTIAEIKKELKASDYNQRDISKAIKTVVDEKLVQRGEKQPEVKSDANKTQLLQLIAGIITAVVVIAALFLYVFK